MDDVQAKVMAFAALEGGKQEGFYQDEDSQPHLCHDSVPTVLSGAAKVQGEEKHISREHSRKPTRPQPCRNRDNKRAKGEDVSSRMAECRIAKLKADDGINVS